MPAHHSLHASPPIFLQDWRAWLPVAEEAATPAALDAARVMHDATPRAAAIPAMLRRRLTPLGRAICEMLDALAVGADNLPLVHASQHGDGHRPLDMLDAIAAGEALSPTRFSLSVHNAILGVYSIAAGHRASMAAVAAGGEEFAALMGEARGYFAEGFDEVAVVLSDSPLPERYRARDVSPSTPAAIVLRLSRHAGRPIVAEPGADDVATDVPPARITPWRLIEWIGGGAPLHTRRTATRWRLLDASPCPPGTQQGSAILRDGPPA